MEPSDVPDAVAGAVLVGGASRRMGRSKAWVPVGGVPMAVLVARALQAGGCRPVVFVGGDRDDPVDPADPADPARHEPDVPTVADLHPGAGPLGAVLTALHAFPGDVVVAACDLPTLDGASVRALLAADPEGTSAVVVGTSEGHHVALARWRRSALAELTAQFAAGHRSWRSALATVPTSTVEFPAHRVADVDTPAELAELERRLGLDEPRDHRR